MAGRKDIIDSILEALDGEPSSPDLTSIFVGARGTGKTALLSYLSTEAQQRGWVSVDVSAAPGMLEDIYEQCLSSASHLLNAEPKRRLNQVKINGIGALGWDNSDRSDNWRTRMNAIFEQLDDSDTGILITVDEVDPRLDEMAQLALVAQHFVREDKRIALFMAGLPSNIYDLVSGKRTSFLRRASRYDLGSIPDYEVEEAFRLTVADGGKTIGQPAMNAAVAAIGGFPFMFQLVGYRSWNASKRNDELTERDISIGIRLAKEELKSKVFDATYTELSRGDRVFLNAMLLDDGATQQRDLSKRLGKNPSYVSSYKKRLLRQGIIEEFPKGTLAFCLPGFRDYLVEQNRP